MYTVVCYIFSDLLARERDVNIIGMNRINFFILVMLPMMFSACSSQPVYPPPSLSGRDVVIDVSTLKPEIPQFYTYQYNGKNISFFVIKLNERVVSFFDACASCYPHKRGYKYDDGSVVCRACNMRFSVYKLEKGLGGCYPIQLQGRTENGKYLIPLASLEQEAGKF
jgi:uncharacterized membrane protein